MAITNFDIIQANQFVGPSSSGLPATSGKYFWVDSTSGSNGGDGTVLSPFATETFALTKCVSGDVVVLMPGYTRTISGALGVNFNVAGVTIITMGQGASKATYSFSNTASTLGISAASVRILGGIRLTPTVDQVVTGLAITANDFVADIEIMETADNVEFVKGVLGTTVSRGSLNINYLGRVGGTHCTTGVSLNGCSNIDITGKFNGKASTAWVNFVTVACSNIRINADVNNAGTSLTKTVVDTITGSKWTFKGFDEVAGSMTSGSDAAAIAGDDVSAVISSLGTSSSTTTLDTVEGAAATTQDAFSDLKAVLQRLGADNNNNTAATTLVADNRDGSVFERLESVIATLRDDVASNYIGIDNANNTASTATVVANRDGSILERLEALMDPLAGYSPKLGFGVTKVSNLADGGGTDNLFDIAGRVLITSLTGEVTTIIGGAATVKIRDVINNVDLCAATTIDTDAVGTMYALTSISANILNGTGATPVIGSIPNITGAQQIDVAIVGNAQATLTLAQVLDAADTGAITWRLTYVPLISGATVTAAA